MRRIYLAGPDVFHREAQRLGASKTALCADRGFRGLYPGDASLPPAALDRSRAIYAACLAMMAEADCGIFNLTPFRGPSADVGTVFELGVMIAHGKPCFAYTNAADDLLGRLHQSPGLTFDEATQFWRDPLGMMAEDFGNADNLMLDKALATQGRRIHRRAVPEAERFDNLDGFIACLNEAQRFYTSV